MKKVAAVLITFVFVYTGLCQDHFRVQAGSVFNYLNAQGTASYSKLRVGFTFGAGYEMVAAKHFSIQPELNFTHLNVKETVTASDIKLSYIQIPVLLKCVDRNRTFSGYVGPQLGFITKATSKSAGKSTDIKDNLTQTEVSGLVGIEYITPINITINARFSQGFSNVFKVEFDNHNKSRNQSFFLTVGYVFGNKK